MRVIAGTARGRLLKRPGGQRVRPTTDLVKGALFNVLAATVEGARFLDLFAGTGNVGIEALSRGAREAVFVDADPACCRVIRQNIRHVGFQGRARVWCTDVRRFVDRARRKEDRYTIIFLDPPYEAGLVAKSLKMIGKAALFFLAEGGVVVAEHSRREQVPSEAALLGKQRELVYGDTVLSFYVMQATGHRAEGDQHIQQEG